MNFSSVLRSALPLFPADAYIVGGTVRDRLLGRPTSDIDIVVAAEAGAVAVRVAAHLNGKAFPLDAERDIHRVSVANNLHLDIAVQQGRSWEDDLDRRDFSINALAVPLVAWLTPRWKSALRDRHNGQADLQKKRLCLVSNKAFQDDPLRLLRAYRHFAELGFSIDAGTSRLIQKQRLLLKRCAPERIREELMRIFASSRTHATLVAMDKARLLDVIFPDAVPLRRTAPAYYGKGGVLKHTLDSVCFFEEIERALATWFPGSQAKIRRYLAEPLAGYPRAAHCKWALVLHDIGKPATAKIIKGRLRFFEHEHVGADRVAKLADLYRWSRDETDRYARLVRHHMRPGNLAVHEPVSDKAIHRFFRDLQDDGVAMLLVSLADHLTYLTAAQRRKRSSAHERITIRMIRRFYHQPLRVTPPKIINGTDVMKAFHLPPSVLIGRLLEDVSDAQSEGTVHTREQALTYLKGRLEWHQQQLAAKTPAT